MIEHTPVPKKAKDEVDLYQERVAAHPEEDRSQWVQFMRVDDILARLNEQGPNIMANEHFAKEVDPDELCREPGNGGRPLDQDYVENNKNARELFVNATADGNLYRSPAVFEDYLKQAHGLAAAKGVYDRVGAGGDLRADKIGVFREPHKELSVSGSRRETAKQIAEIARQYHDPYAERFTERRKGVTYSPHLRDMMHLPKEGRSRDLAAGPDGFYLFNYPEAQYIPDYMAQMTKIGKQIEDELHAEKPDLEKAAWLIGMQYSYGAIIRPFTQINNSLFMNLANAQLKLFGLKGVSHGVMDHAAQRMQTDNFSRYFADRVFGRTK